jgi:hypothetical protein
LVIGEGFAWVHVPKTGGDATYAMFAAAPDLILDSDSLDSNDKHLGFWARKDALAGKQLVMNIRRLPAWSLSAAHHKAAVGLHPDFEPLPLDSADEMAESTDPDDMLRWLTGGGDFKVDRWLRTEHLEQDVIALLDELGALTPKIDQRVRAVGRVSKQAYERDLAQRFTSAQIERMYARNPGWTAVERRMYGGLLGEHG